MGLAFMMVAHESRDLNANRHSHEKKKEGENTIIHGDKIDS